MIATIGKLSIEFVKYDKVEPWFYAFWFHTGIDVHFGVWGVICSLLK